MSCLLLRVLDRTLESAAVEQDAMRGTSGSGRLARGGGAVRTDTPDALRDARSRQEATDALLLLLLVARLLAILELSSGAGARAGGLAGRVAADSWADLVAKPQHALGALLLYGRLCGQPQLEPA
eukprot:2999826-Prymnesium_polylepis.1